MAVARPRLVVALAVACALCGGVLGLVDPYGFAGSFGWAFVVMGVLWGYGSAVGRWCGVALGPGEQIVLGATVWIGLVGPLLAAGVASRGPLFALAMLGLGLALVELVRRARAESGVREAAPPRLVLGMLLVAYLVITVIGTIWMHSNAYDDHLAYGSLAKRLLDAGNLVEPFSFRRISAYGGQTVLLALAGLRGNVESTELLDRGIFQAITLLVVIDVARHRKLDIAVTTLVVLFVISVWDITSNSASTWTGVAVFLGTYSIATNETAPRRMTLPLTFAACAAACTLRQSYLVPAAIFAALLLLAHVRTSAATWRAAWIAERRTVAICIAVVTVFLLPYIVAAQLSNHTFLYPIVAGTANPAAPMRPSSGTIAQELAFFVHTAFETEPIKIWWLLFPFMLLVKDTRAFKPWRSYVISCVVGFVFLIHSFVESDPLTLWRYAFAYMTPLAVIFVIEAAGRLPIGDDGPRLPLRLPLVAICFVWLAVFAQFVWQRHDIVTRVTHLMHNVDLALVRGTERSPATDAYRALQASLPEGARVAILVDDPQVLDFRRNEIVNLDLVGFAAPAPGLPAFLGPERWRSYLAAQGIRYVAFVDGDSSVCLFRRKEWVHRLFENGELWRFMAAHMIDAQDTLQSFTKTARILFQRDGLVAVDLGADVPPPPAIADPPDPVRQDAFIRHISETELGDATWQLASRSNVAFVVDPLGPADLDIDHQADPTVDGAFHALFGIPLHEPPHRWLSDRTHIRVRGNGAQHVHVKVRANRAKLYTIPTAYLTLDGHELGHAVADGNGTVVFDADVTCSGWCDLYLMFSTMSEFWKPADVLLGFELLELEWTPR